MTPLHSRSPRPLGALRSAALLLSALSLCLGPACSSPRPEENPEQESTTATASFTLGADEFHLPPGSGDDSIQGRRRSAYSSDGVSASSFTYANVTRIRINVTDIATSVPVYVNFDLAKDATGIWRGTLPFLPKNTLLSFHARATNAADTLLFEGITEQSLSANFETVVLVLAPANNNQTVTIPRILRIAVPTAFGSDQSGNVSFSVEAATGEQLTYAITATAGAGTFYPTSGTLTLTTTSGTFVSQYAPPTVSAETTFTHEVLITNSAGHSVATTFTTRVRAPGNTDGVLDSALNVLFNPVINGLKGARVVETDRVYWTADVDDDGADAELRYAWSFTPTGTFDPVPAFADATSNPGLLQGYTMAVQGTLRLDVTDHNGTGGTTTLFYQLRPNQFLDDPTDEAPTSGINSIRVGASHTCALFNDGSLRCWGLNNYGQLGLGSTFWYGDDEPAHAAGPVPLVGVGTKLALGGQHTCALLNTGLVRCWGQNVYGQLGYNTTEHVGDGEQIASYGYVNLGGIATKLAAGAEHTCALMNTGKVRCWGRNNHGQLGYGHTYNVGDNEQPYFYGDVNLGPDVTVKDIVAGEGHTCALLTTGSVRCWGLNSSGQLGTGSTSNPIGDTEVPADSVPVNVGGPVRQLSAGNNHTCAVLAETDNVRCWGLNSWGQLGYGHHSIVTTPSADVNVGGPVLQVAGGEIHTCALLSTGTVKCWGHGGHGQLGYPNTSLLNEPGAAVSIGGASAFQIATGGRSTCALLSTGGARCWGINNYGQLGYGHTNPIGDNELPSSQPEVPILPPALP